MRALAFLVVAHAACAQSEPEPGPVRFAIPFTAGQQVGCATPSNLDGMTATLFVGGHIERPCPLNVNPTTHEVSGTCDGITIGIFRPMAIVYEIDAGSGDKQLAYLPGFAHLEKDQISEDTTTVPVEFLPENELYDEIAALALEDELNAPARQPENDIERALIWFFGFVMRESLTGNQVLNLDADDDDCPNLVELCNGVLETVGDTTCN
jgi:hypothetical protein